MYMTSSLDTLRNGSIALIAFVLLALPMTFAHAADMDESGWYTDGYTDSYPYAEDTGWVTDSYTDSYPYGSDYGYDTGYMGGSGYTGSGYLGGGYIGGGSYLPTPHTSTGGQTQTQSQGQSSNNVNTNVNNNVITINTPAAPAPVYNYPQPTYNYPVCTLTVNNYGYNNGYNYNNQPVTLSWTSQYATSGFISNGVGSVALSGSVSVNPQYTTTYTGTFYGQNGQTVTCSATVTRGPVAYNSTPYIALSAAPYTGLDLGFWGTIAYWGFLVLWCLAAAYLVVVKKVQNRMLRAINSFLFGDAISTHQVVTATSTPMHSAPVHTYSAPVVATQVDAIDDFIMSQVNKAARRA